MAFSYHSLFHLQIKNYYKRTTDTEGMDLRKRHNTLQSRRRCLVLRVGVILEFAPEENGGEK